MCVLTRACVCVFPLRLPSISLLNGSVVTDVEREDAERFFIRYYQDYPEEELPCRYAPFQAHVRSAHACGWRLIRSFLSVDTTVS